MRTGSEAERFDGVAERRVEGRVAVVEDESQVRIVREGLADLLSGLCGGGMPRELTCRMCRRSWARTTKTNRIGQVSVGTAKKSTATVERRWFSRNVRHVCEGGVRRRGISREIVRSETASPSFNSSPSIRGAPHSGFSAAISRMRRRTSAATGGRPPFGRDRRVQYQAKPRRCQPMTVARRTTTKADFQSGHAHRSPSQNSRSDQRVVGFGRVRWYTANCCRSARFSRTRFRSRLARTSSSRTTWMNLATMFQSNRPGARGWVAEWARLGLANHRLLKESVLQIWKARKAAVCDEIATAERAAKAIEEKLDRLDQAFLFERSIDRSRARCRGLPSHALARPPQRCRTLMCLLNYLDRELHQARRWLSSRSLARFRCAFITTRSFYFVEVAWSNDAAVESH